MELERFFLVVFKPFLIDMIYDIIMIELQNIVILFEVDDILIFMLLHVMDY